MDTVGKRKGGLLVGILTLLLLWCAPVQAVVDGVAATSFSLVAKQDYISNSDGDSILMWGYALEASNPAPTGLHAGFVGRMLYPGPTLIVPAGQPITITLRNQLPAAHGQNVSIVFPGQVVTASGGVAGALTREAEPGGISTVTYSFVATNPGTYLYRSGTRPDLQVEMGLVGALIVRPAGNPTTPDSRTNSPDLTWAYNHPDTAYHHEYLYLVTEVDVNIHRMVEGAIPGKSIADVDMTEWFPVSWFVNGRAFPDLMQPAFVPWFPTQPYNCLPRVHPFEKLLIRVIGAGLAQHPMHYHGQDFSVIAENGRLLSSNGGAAGPDLAWKASTYNFTPGQTADLIWEWYGVNLGWDPYGHTPSDPVLVGYEDPAEHGQPFPVVLAQRDDLAFGQFWSGSPFLGGTGDLPPEAPGLNTSGGFLFPWHSHSEKELTSNDVFPGGALTFVILEYPTVAIP